MHLGELRGLAEVLEGGVDAVQARGSAPALAADEITVLRELERGRLVPDPSTGTHPHAAVWLRALEKLVDATCERVADVSVVADPDDTPVLWKLVTTSADGAVALPISPTGMPALTHVSAEKAGALLAELEALEPPPAHLVPAASRTAIHEALKRATAESSGLWVYWSS
ncbi:MAG TPA: hypothetical protein RMH85_22340 [Polyangiaceae bacterium LLY-WYZ-15_(1-7)]|nr:hypothetical protein [Polyangiaceae bacterium LLY-WYZ-15_(1-7)]HJL11230.1 hypothetical protein [Polyangiaceae bacterium LLY-WYZ-15_(1-7)]HJL20873.1 hypothetical protein [Polyangiaceae bacterium LLY-WYZ-15_(1-7)]HJL35632.1 hypothetical protein [Polyangiaceae bacterium LLY-WYZ-15_(1-7)]HJL47312.1 hypothetical protein [Polyangiaceae bacterium LLY-WYZ-15_(1-7)]